MAILIQLRGDMAILIWFNGPLHFKERIDWISALRGIILKRV
jgi:hypothetical protein